MFRYSVLIQMSLHIYIYSFFRPKIDLIMGYGDNIYILYIYYIPHRTSVLDICWCGLFIVYMFVKNVTICPKTSLLRIYIYIDQLCLYLYNNGCLYTLGLDIVIISIFMTQKSGQWGYRGRGLSYIGYIVFGDVWWKNTYQKKNHTGRGRDRGGMSSHSGTYFFSIPHD